MIIQTRVDIARTPQEVFDFLTDRANWAKVDSALVDFSPHGPVALGRTGTFRHRRAGLRVTTSWEITEFVPNARLEVLIVGRGYELRETASLAAGPVGTRATFVDTLTPTSLPGRVMVALSRGIVRRDLQRRSAKVKSMLEAGSQGPSAARA